MSTPICYNAAMPSRRQLEMEHAEISMLLKDFIKIEETFRDVARLIDLSYNTTDVAEKQKVLKEARELLKTQGY